MTAAYNGATVDQLRSMSGWANAEMALAYTRAAEQAPLAKAQDESDESGPTFQRGATTISV